MSYASTGTAEMAGLRVLLVDDCESMRERVRWALERAGMTVVGEAADGAEALTQAAARRPDVVLMDLHMPKLGGVEATEAISRAHPEVKVVVLTSFGEVERVHAALAAGAAGYLLKDAEPEEVGTAIRAAAVGEVHLDSAVARQLTRRMTAPQVGLSALTAREREILALVAAGNTTSMIAAELWISPGTVRKHLDNVFAKLGVHTRAAAVAVLATVPEGR
jgi:DNA-binding NarL/FixJ family response regulator